jgi:hypothetical protein
VSDGRTGVLVDTASAEAFAAGLEAVGKLDRDPDIFKAQADRFSRARFLTDFQAVIDSATRERAAPSTSDSEAIR